MKDSMLKRFLEENEKDGDRFKRLISRLNALQDSVVSEFITDCMDNGTIPTNTEVMLIKAGTSYMLSELGTILRIIVEEYDL